MQLLGASLRKPGLPQDKLFSYITDLGPEAVWQGIQSFVSFLTLLESELVLNIVKILRTDIPEDRPSMGI
jgi:hypothetical protein